MTKKWICHLSGINILLLTCRKRQVDAEKREFVRRAAGAGKKISQMQRWSDSTAGCVLTVWLEVAGDEAYQKKPLSYAELAAEVKHPERLSGSWRQQFVAKSTLTALAIDWLENSYLDSKSFIVCIEAVVERKMFFMYGSTKNCLFGSSLFCLNSVTAHWEVQKV